MQLIKELSKAKQQGKFAKTLYACNVSEGSSPLIYPKQWPGDPEVN